MIAPSTAATMTDMMIDVVCYGTGKLAQMPGMSVAGKTGTAYKSEDGGYGEAGNRKYRATFVGFFPAQAPRDHRPGDNRRTRSDVARPLRWHGCRTAVHHRRHCRDPRVADHASAERHRLPGGVTAVKRLLGDLLFSSDALLPAFALHGDDDVAITGVVFDSRRVMAGSLFCCVPGDDHDGHDFAAAAVAAGATALLCERTLPLSVPQLVVPNARAAMGLLAAAFFGHPSRDLILVGITGTNGKTTTCSLLASVLSASGLATGVIGTLTGKHTTPEAPDLQEQLAEFVAKGTKAVVIEVSSHALALHRVAGCRFTLAVFTNLGRDHLDLHGTLERYFAAKAKLFEPDLSDRGIANVDDPRGQQLVDDAHIPMTGFSLRDISGLVVTPTSHHYRWRNVEIRVGIGGAFNSMNSLGAATAAAELGIATDVIAAGLASAPAVRGRFRAGARGTALRCHRRLRAHSRRTARVTRGRSLGSRSRDRGLRMWWRPRS